MIRVGRRLTVLSVALSALWAAAPAVAGPLIDPRTGCVHAEELRGYEPVSRVGDSFDYFGEPGANGTMAIARRGRGFAERDRVWQRWHRLLRANPLPSLDERGRPVRERIYFTSERFRTEIGGRGLYAPYCDREGRRSTLAAVVLISDRAANDPVYGDLLRTTVGAFT